MRPAQQELVLSVSYVMVDESNSIADYGVKLNTQPTGDVTVEVASSDAGIATLDTASNGEFESSSITLTFKPDDWSTDKEVHVEGVNDDVDNLGDSRLAIITHTPSGGGYGSGDVKTVHAWVKEAPGNDDVVGLTFDPVNLQLALDEYDKDNTSNNDTYTVVLNSEPTERQ